MAYSYKSKQGGDSFPGPIFEARSASTAGGGTALTTTASIIGIPDKTTHVTLRPRNYTTAAVVKVALNPFLDILFTSNGLQSATDYSQVSQQTSGTRNLVLDAMGTLANGYALYLGAPVPFRGFAYTSNQANANTSVLSANYWNGTAWTAVAGLTDGTASGGATFAQTGNVTYTVPSGWKTTYLWNTVNQLSPVSGWNVQPGNPSQPNIPVTPIQAQGSLPYQEQNYYWLQVTVSAALSVSVSASSLYALNRSTAYAELLSADAFSFRMIKGQNGIACVEALTDAGTANLIVDVFTDTSSVNSGF